MSKRIVSAKGGAMSAEGHTTRRAALGALASALVIPKVARAATADPIFAAIERHTAAWTVIETMVPAVDDVAAMRRGREVAQVDLHDYERASGIEEEALDELLATAPTTAAGIRAAIKYFIAFDDGRLLDDLRPFLVTLLKSPLFSL